MVTENATENFVDLGAGRYIDLNQVKYFADYMYADKKRIEHPESDYAHKIVNFCYTNKGVAQPPKCVLYMKDGDIVLTQLSVVAVRNKFINRGFFGESEVVKPKASKKKRTVQSAAQTDTKP